jgi:hypothetical protein
VPHPFTPCGRTFKYLGNVRNHPRAARESKEFYPAQRVLSTGGRLAMPRSRRCRALPTKGLGGSVYSLAVRLCGSAARIFVRSATASCRGAAGVGLTDASLLTSNGGLCRAAGAASDLEFLDTHHVNEAHLPAVRRQAQAHPRLPRPDEDAGRPRRHRCAPRQGPQAARGLTGWTLVVRR